MLESSTQPAWERGSADSRAESPGSHPTASERAASQPERHRTPFLNDSSFVTAQTSAPPGRAGRGWKKHPAGCANSPEGMDGVKTVIWGFLCLLTWSVQGQSSHRASLAGLGWSHGAAAAGEVWCHLGRDGHPGAVTQGLVSPQAGMDIQELSHKVWCHPKEGWTSRSCHTRSGVTPRKDGHPGTVTQGLVSPQGGMDIQELSHKVWCHPRRDGHPGTVTQGLVSPGEGWTPRSCHTRSCVTWGGMDIQELSHKVWCHPNQGWTSRSCHTRSGVTWGGTSRSCHTRSGVTWGGMDIQELSHKVWCHLKRDGHPGGVTQGLVSPGEGWTSRSCHTRSGVTPRRDGHQGAVTQGLVSPGEGWTSRSCHTRSDVTPSRDGHPRAVTQSLVSPGEGWTPRSCHTGSGVTWGGMDIQEVSHKVWCHLGRDGHPGAVTQGLVSPQAGMDIQGTRNCWARSDNHLKSDGHPRSWE
ncbi:uncharacterized protein LOC117000352 isoform X1 [Catharus ustulatus]|uniref:uncharacterized protein LOC117000352 isoform X1 n=1 Tax=Catharus ustulatus TaxID=91951 RepID=UPI001407E665|nr:uncharacterized protein LOC117000352 isoform X1 [Catharus ustulatus]